MYNAKCCFKLVKISKKQEFKKKKKNHAHAPIFLSSHEYLVKLSMSVVALRAFALNKCIMMSLRCPPRP